MERGITPVAAAAVGLGALASAAGGAICDVTMGFTRGSATVFPLIDDDGDPTNDQFVKNGPSLLGGMTLTPIVAGQPILKVEKRADGGVDIKLTNLQIDAAPGPPNAFGSITFSATWKHPQLPAASISTHADGTATNPFASDTVSMDFTATAGTTLSSTGSDSVTGSGPFDSSGTGATAPILAGTTDVSGSFDFEWTGTQTTIFLQDSFTVTLIPTPGSVGWFAACGAVALRRRRRVD